MELDQIKKEAEKMGLFELNLLNAHIHQLLDEPDRIEPLASSLKTGMDVTIFDAYENETLEATVISVLKKNVRVFLHERKQFWKCPIHWINTKNIPTRPKPKEVTGKLTRQDLQIGDTVGFQHKGEDLYGKVLKLNPKKARIILSSGDTWTVSYGLLFTALDVGVGSSERDLLAPGTILIEPN